MNLENATSLISFGGVILGWWSGGGPRRLLKLEIALTIGAAVGASLLSLELIQRGEPMTSIKWAPLVSLFGCGAWYSGRWLVTVISAGSRRPYSKRSS